MEVISLSCGKKFCGTPLKLVNRVQKRTRTSLEKGWKWKSDLNVEALLKGSQTFWFEPREMAAHILVFPCDEQGPRSTLTLLPLVFSTPKLSH